MFLYFTKTFALPKYLLGILLKMSNNFFASRYVSNYQSSNIPWYERDVLLTYIDTLRCKEFLDNCGKHFSNNQVASFSTFDVEVLS